MGEAMLDLVDRFVISRLLKKFVNKRFIYNRGRFVPFDSSNGLPTLTMHDNFAKLIKATQEVTNN
jgi:hypothetical protein